MAERAAVAEELGDELHDAVFGTDVPHCGCACHYPPYPPCDPARVLLCSSGPRQCASFGHEHERATFDLITPEEARERRT